MHKNSTENKGTLYLVATPIGNLEDITLRAIRVLKEAHYIAAEDTRHTKKLLNHLGISTPLISYYREQEKQRADKILALLDDGNSVAVVTDAGTPAISDPGSVIVKKARQGGYNIVPVPGASALTAALSCAGIEDKGFVFHGFAPAKTGQRKQLLQTLVHTQLYTIFYESPHRVEAFLRDAFAILGDRKTIMARELTKAYEEIIESSIGDLRKRYSQSKSRGEYVFILSPSDDLPAEKKDIEELLIWYRDNSALSMNECCKIIAADLGETKSKIYKKAVTIWKK